MSPLPKKGDQIQFKGGELFAFHTNCVENAKNLVPGELYTVDSVEMASSWTRVTIEELPTKGVFGDDWLALNFFQWPRCQVMKNSPGGMIQCKNPAEYTYMAAKEGEISEYCLDCIFELSKGQPCSCEIIFVPGVDIQKDPESGEMIDFGENPPIQGQIGVHWKWLKENVSWYLLDEKGRPFPCCEYSPTDYLQRKSEERISYLIN